MERAPVKEYSDFDGSLQELADLWMELGAEFRRELKKIRGIEL
jgi:hypothetical protein